jgi:methyl-accepting chemotaxis protein
MAHIGFADKHAVFRRSASAPPTTIPRRGPGTSRRPRRAALIITAPYIGASTGKLVVTFA